MYIFVLPDDKKNRTIVLRKSNFSPAIFPNISVIDKRIQSHQLNYKSQSIFGSLAQNNRIQRSKLKDDEFDLDSYATTNDDEKYVEIVAENVRTEKNFFQFMDKLNKDKINSGGENVFVPSAAAYKQQQLQSGDNLLDVEHIFQHGYQLPLETSGDGYLNQRSKNAKQKNNSKVSWRDLGLNGWSGRLSRPAWNFRKSKRYMRVNFYMYSNY